MVKRRKTQRERIYAYIKRRPKSGATRRELVKALKILHQSVGPRVVELLDDGLIRPTGEYRKECEVLRVW